MLKKKLTLVINSCDKFSDLWENHIDILNKSWPDREAETLLVTDKDTTASFEGVEIFSAGEKKEYPQRMAAALPRIKTEYILITLDDYFPIKKIENWRLERLIEIMDAEKLDYIRLFADPNSRKPFKKYKKLYEIPLDVNYAVNLYQGIWRRDFVEKTLKEAQTIWKYEVSLTPTARELGARCVLSKGGEFEILDVIRKGKLLHKASRWLKRNGRELPEREVISRKEEIRIKVFAAGKKILPKKLAIAVKNRLRKKGFVFFSDAV